VEHADALKPLVPQGSSMPDMALRFILASPDVDVVIPGMRKPSHVRSNIASSDAPPLPNALLEELKRHRWDRTPSDWSQ
jgi:aryl-alcohol dehydrogenase-like predicted oxidoreductase